MPAGTQTGGEESPPSDSVAERGAQPVDGRFEFRQLRRIGHGGAAPQLVERLAEELALEPLPQPFGSAAGVLILQFLE